jgi:hypothetical protein
MYFGFRLYPILYCCKITILKMYKVLIIKANEMHYFSDLFDKVLYMFRAGLLSIIRSNSTLYTRSMYLSC